MFHHWRAQLSTACKSKRESTALLWISSLRLRPPQRQIATWRGRKDVAVKMGVVSQCSRDRPLTWTGSDRLFGGSHWPSCCVSKGTTNSDGPACEIKFRYHTCWCKVGWNRLKSQPFFASKMETRQDGRSCGHHDSVEWSRANLFTSKWTMLFFFPSIFIVFFHWWTLAACAAGLCV